MLPLTREHNKRNRNWHHQQRVNERLAVLLVLAGPSIYPGNRQGQGEGESQRDDHRHRVGRVDQQVDSILLDQSSQSLPYPLHYGRAHGVGLGQRAHHEKVPLLRKIEAHAGQKMERPGKKHKPGQVVENEADDDVLEHALSPCC